MASNSNDDSRFVPTWMQDLPSNTQNKTRFVPSWMQNMESNKTQNNHSIRYIEFHGKVVYCTQATYLAAYTVDIMDLIDDKKIHYFGFDMEWPVLNGKSLKTALIQICVNHTLCYIFHVYLLQKLPNVFQNLLNTPNVRWSGVCIKNDFLKLSRDFNIDLSVAISNIIDLATYTNQVLNFESNLRWSMADLVQYLLKKHVNKDVQIRMGNWNNTNLNEKQLMYAATDAYISLILFEHLKNLE
ncbi:3'-5' exonuclease [Adelges cooleyi]|uniref:3'-5' exonuclease n=1 Tax=Adelges cooleyi TaxID=133065 RepID=UPI002180813A|nr:3'-5' exonuclease [Adelges cooleyi]